MGDAVTTAPATGSANATSSPSSVTPSAQHPIIYPSASSTNGQQPSVVIVQPPSQAESKAHQNVVIEEHFVYSNDFMWCGVILILICNPICGIPSLILGCLSHYEAAAGRTERAKSYGKGACWLGCIGFLTSLIAVSSFIIWFTVIWPQLRQEVTNWRQEERLKL